MFEFLALTGLLLGVVIVVLFVFAKGNAAKLEPTPEEQAELERYTSGMSSNQHD